MSNTMRWRYGETNPVMQPTNSGHVVEIGDLVYLDVNVAKPASSQADQGTLTANQELFHDNFLGVAMQASKAGETTPIRIATSGVFEFACNAEAFEMGDLIGGNEEGTGTQLDQQMVTGVAAANLSIGRCVSRVPSPSNAVLMEVVSTIVRGGPEAAA